MITQKRYIEAKKIVEKYENQIKVKYTKDTTITETDIDCRSYNALLAYGLSGWSTLEDVSKVSRSLLISYNNVGIKTIRALESILEKADLEFNR